MADKDQYDDEYQFSDLDAVNIDPDEAESGYDESASSEPQTNMLASNNIKRNALIVVALVILAMVVYKFLGAFVATEDDVIQPVTPQVQPAQQDQPPPARVQPIEPQAQSVALDPNVEQKLSAMESRQQNLRSDVGSVKNQINKVNSNINAVATQISQLHQIVVTLNNKIDQQSGEIMRLKSLAKPAVAPNVVKKPSEPVKKYYVQALIPGRAWLISSNGTTLTVREGSTISGYGTVKLIDPQQGQVITSSGKVIKFGQYDS
jgi:intracellular multiplication protein IcmG